MLQPNASTCEAVLETVSAQLDGERGPIARRALRRHLAACEACRAFALTAGGLRHVLGGQARRLVGPVRTPPPELLARLATGEPAGTARETRATPAWRSYERTVQKVRRWALATVPAGALAGALLLAAPTQTHLYPTPPTLCRVHPQLPGLR